MKHAHARTVAAADVDSVAIVVVVVTVGTVAAATTAATASPVGNYGDEWAFRKDAHSSLYIECI